MAFETVGGWPVLGSLNEFIDYAQVIVLILIVYYIFRFFMVGGPSQEEREREGEAFRNWVRERGEGRRARAGEAAERQRTEQEVATRRRLLDPARGFIIRAEENAGETIDDLRHHTAAGLTHARDRVRRIQDNLRSARRVIRAAQVHSQGERRTFLGELQARAELMEQDVHNHMHNYLPTNHTVRDWNARLRYITDHARNIRARCGHLIHSIDQFIASDERNLPPDVAPPSGPAPTASP